MKTTSLFLLAAVLLSACGNECDFFERCDGIVREICGEGVDQQVNRKVKRVACEAPNAACVQLSKNQTACVVSPVTACAADSCSGSVATVCVSDADGGTFAQNRDCAADGGTCRVPDAGQALCQ